MTGGWLAWMSRARQAIDICYTLISDLQPYDGSMAMVRYIYRYICPNQKSSMHVRLYTIHSWILWAQKYLVHNLLSNDMDQHAKQMDLQF